MRLGQRPDGRGGAEVPALGRESAYRCGWMHAFALRRRQRRGRDRAHAMRQGRTRPPTDAQAGDAGLHRSAARPLGGRAIPLRVEERLGPRAPGPPGVLGAGLARTPRRGRHPPAHEPDVHAVARQRPWRRGPRRGGGARRHRGRGREAPGGSQLVETTAATSVEGGHEARVRGCQARHPDEKCGRRGGGRAPLHDRGAQVGQLEHARLRGDHRRRRHHR
mmetsp:Transcript_131522/g.380426  ORF Transcript_131522/g.380426 Transcript_131522/m.380426 type:complete len:220 (-) Transcript_131522:2123-2782(-)